jgi:transposase
MGTRRGRLPEDIAACHALIEKQEQLIAGLQHQVEQLLRSRYGRRSEKLDPDQLELFQGYLTAGWEGAVEETPAAEPEAAGGSPEGEGRAPGKRRGRKPLPAHLPRQRVEHDVPAGERKCPECGSEREKIGEDSSEQLEYVPASLVVLEHARMKYACRRCQGHVVVAGKPYQPIERGLPGPGLLAHVVTSKYAEHLPLYRQEGILERHGVEISRQTTCGWCAASARLLEPLWELMKSEVLSGRKIHTDDTPVPVLDPGRGRTKTGRLWV